MKSAYKLSSGIGSAVVGILFTAAPSLAVTFRYTTPTTTTLYTEDEVTVAGVTFDGSFDNTIFNPFSNSEQTFSGFYTLQSGTLGEAVSIQAVQQSPIDRTGYFEAGLSNIEYLAQPVPIPSDTGVFAALPDMSFYDFRLDPAPISDAPTVLSRGWEAEKVPEPGSGLVILGLAVYGSARMKRKL